MAFAKTVARSRLSLSIVHKTSPASLLWTSQRRSSFVYLPWLGVYSCPLSTMAKHATIFHNPRCSKSRTAINLIEDERPDIDFTVVQYLKTPLTTKELGDLEKKLGKSVHEWTRTGEKIYKELGLSPSTSRDEMLQAMSENPILMERPICVIGDKAVVGRPPTNIVEFIEEECGPKP